ncbi:hypothetical protein TorRG33x02_285240 [Trema orientale]|uniref:Uncharacterized protein n=1 Tax=Trema orientale TaxID=63057 RepID=A0A2P5CGX6_TREOI|nr:hypothetical protein TorRG33x02_285240 [Trema orientale]
MELRSCNHLHYIQAVKGGLAIKTLNVNRGRPVLKFKTLEDICETLETKDQNVILQPTDKFDGLLFDSNGVKVEGPTLSTLAKRILISDPDASEFSCSDDDGRNSHMDDLGFGEMTLKQIKENCKAKKRKRAKYVDFKIDEMCNRLKQETDEDECDLMEPLINWKSKVSKKVKAKRRSSRNLVSSSSKIATSNIKDEQILDDPGFVQSEGSLPAPINIKVEVPEPDSSKSQSAILFAGDCSLLYDNQVDSCGVVQREVTESATEFDPRIHASCSDGQDAISFLVDFCGVVPRKEIKIANECDPGIQALCSDSQNVIDDSSLICDNQVDSFAVEPIEVTEIASECDWGNEELVSLTREPQCCVASEAYHDYAVDVIPQPLQIVDSLPDTCGIVPKETTESTECVLGTQKLISLTEEPQYCVVNEACFEYMEHDDSEQLQIPSASCDDINKVDISELTNQQCSDLPVSESKGEGYVDQTVCDDIFQEPMMSTSDRSSDIHDDCPSPSTNHATPCNYDCNTNVQIPAVAVHGCLQYIESIHESEANVPEDNTKDDLPTNLETSSLHSSDDKNNSGPDSWFAPSIDDLPTTEDKQSQRSSGADAESVCFPEIVHPDASEKLATSDGGESYHHDSMLNRPPQRLLSTRKAISPDSQEKLCQAVESIELHDEEHYKPRKKLCFGQQTGKKTKTTTAERSGQIARVKFSANHKQNKTKDEKRLDQPEGGDKDPHLSQAAPRFSTGCTSIETCSQNAIAFSQRQMQDIECLATKLTNELKTMKEIAEDRLFSETCPATSLQYKANEVRMAIKNANRVEQLAKRWLSIMARDCSRFCKIMRLTENDSGAPERETVVNKERKKITFADEAGEELCHVRFFKNEYTSSLEPTDTEKPELVD